MPDYDTSDHDELAAQARTTVELTADELRSKYAARLEEITETLIAVEQSLFCNNNPGALAKVRTLRQRIASDRRELQP